MSGNWSVDSGCWAPGEWLRDVSRGITMYEVEVAVRMASDMRMGCCCCMPIRSRTLN